MHCSHVKGRDSQMLFDPITFASSVNELTTSGNREGLEDYLLDEIVRLREGGVITSGAFACCGKSAEELQEEDADFQRNRFQGLIMCASELANLYRNSSEWDKCFGIYDGLRGYVKEAGLTGTPMDQRILVNEAYARIDAQDLDGSAALLDQAEMITEGAEGEVLSRLHDARAVILRSKGDDAGAEEAAKKAVEAIEASAADNVEFVQMVLNHAATLAQLGSPEDAMGAVDELLSPDSGVTLPGDTYYQALNLKAMILYRSGNLKAAADTFAELVDEARERGALKNQLPSICLNCAHIYQRVGDEESATRYSSIAAALSSDGR